MFKLISQKNGIRKGEIIARGESIHTPYYFPVATVGAVRSVAPWELIDLGFKGILANTYHLYLRPGEKLIKSSGGLHQWMGWNGLILTDSGGFQVFSLGKNKKEGSLVKIQNNGVIFTSHIDGSKHFFSPEKVIQIQLDLGSDIIMPLDLCLPGKANKIEAEKAAEKTLEWLKKSKKYFDKKTKKWSQNKKPLLFGIIQGSAFLDLREKFTRETIKLNPDGYAIGGLAVGEEKNKMWSVVKLMNKILPQNKPRYLMGVGELEDFIKAAKLGMDMVDCVLPTRLARHGIAYKIFNFQFSIFKNGPKINKLDLRKKWAREKMEVIDKNCSCLACENKLSVAYLSHLIKENEILGHRLLSLHNLATTKRIMDYLTGLTR